MHTFSYVTRRVVSVLFISSLVVAAGCSSKNKTTKAAPGTATKPTTKQPPSTPKVAKKAGTNVSGSTSSSVAVEGEGATCTAEENGLAACVDTYVVFCSGTKVYALDCAEAFGGTCGEINGEIDCVIQTEE